MTHDQDLELVIRLATVEDAVRVAELLTQLGYPATSMEMRYRIGKSLQDSNQALFLAESDGRVIAWIQVFVRVLLMHDREVEVGALVVDEGFRGRGVGKLLMQRAEQWAKEKKCTTVYLRSNVIRKEAHRFYGNLGYKIVKTQSAFRKVLVQARISKKIESIS